MKYSDLIGVKATDNLSHWIPMCEKWSDFLVKYTSITHESDTAFNTNERANIGTLASAAWASGYIALEEFQDIKGDEKTSRNGRVDLWLRSPCGQSEYIEAKYKKCSINGNFIKHINEYLGKAIDDALHTKGGSDVNSVGLTFFVPYMKKSRSGNITEDLNYVLSTIENNIEHDLLAWCFPERDINYRHYDGYAVPGVIMIARKL
ncbi:hypothetical protein [Photobacterium kasasachensis]|uniref:hypothetical protein n=1 Tax=Photobacterium kasasachensis TaxID=2910240 RepID=UPI003D13A748